MFDRSWQQGMGSMARISPPRVGMGTTKGQPFQRPTGWDNAAPVGNGQMPTTQTPQGLPNMGAGLTQTGMQPTGQSTIAPPMQTQGWRPQQFTMASQPRQMPQNPRMAGGIGMGSTPQFNGKMPNIGNILQSQPQLARSPQFLQLLQMMMGGR